MVSLLENRCAMTLTYVQSSGTSPCCKEAWNIRVIASESLAANPFRNLAGIRSGPSTLWGLRPCINFWTPAWSAVKVCMSGYWLSPGMAVILFCLFYSRIQAASQSKKRPIFSQFLIFISQSKDFISIIPKFKWHRLYPKEGNKITA